MAEVVVEVVATESAQVANAAAVVTVVANAVQLQEAKVVQRVIAVANAAQLQEAKAVQQVTVVASVAEAATEQHLHTELAAKDVLAKVVQVQVQVTHAKSVASTVKIRLQKREDTSILKH